MASFTEFGNDLYTGKRSVGIVRRRRLWYLVAAALVAVSVLVPFLRGGFVFGIEFTGGSEFRVSAPADTSDRIALDALAEVLPGETPRVSVVGGDSVRVQTEQLSDAETREVGETLAEAYEVPVDQVASSFISPTWGNDITSSMLRALVIFLALAALLMTVYFRTWKMSVAAIVALLHDLVITAGAYGVFGFEITPAAVIGLLTILGYSLYDTVVVFDKIRENTTEDAASRTFAESVNLAVNQTLVRSINTSVVAVLPVASILFVGAVLLGAGTLRDIALALFIGMLVGTYSTIFLAAPIYSHLRERESGIRTQDARVLEQREAAAN